MPGKTGVPKWAIIVSVGVNMAEWQEEKCRLQSGKYVKDTGVGTETQDNQATEKEVKGQEDKIGEGVVTGSRLTGADSCELPGKTGKRKRNENKT
ncbi:hypothetical protein NDU88_002237 [Pleurodeles waltl]|uniref:Uncharacterized protein n=1 Tax=Pleurodeles waltl TaxID=8319 RepID=A0AAV7VZ37_PLEWA|nr:hypothetical protein NDU88_002237 [Pleurodeles waltl]